MDSSTLPNTAPTVLVVGRGKAVLAGAGEEALDLVAATDCDGLYREGSLPREVDGWEAGTAVTFPCPASRVKNLCHHAD